MVVGARSLNHFDTLSNLFPGPWRKYVHFKLRSITPLATKVHVIYACTNFNKWHKNKKMTLHILTHGAMQGCGLPSLAVCINDKICDIRERNVTIRSEIWSMNIRSLAFQDIREWVTLRKVILRSLGCISQLKLSYLQTNLCQILHLLSNHLARSKPGASGCK